LNLFLKKLYYKLIYLKGRKEKKKGKKKKQKKEEKKKRNFLNI